MRTLLLIAPLCLCHAASAQVSCPWLTVGTAEAALRMHGRSEIKTEVKIIPPNMEEGRCIFTADHGTLEIVVSSEPQRDCPADSSKLPGIGNEARFCVAGKQFTVDSRVRALHFHAMLTADLPAEDGRKRVELVAEVVSGNLF